MANIIHIKNRKAWHNFTISDKFIAGIQLYGTEIKSIRMGKANITDSYCVFLPIINRPNVFELWIRMHISEYNNASFKSHEPKRERKLLLKKKELRKLERKVKNTGLTIVPTRLFINDRGFAKVEIAIGEGKKNYDKREDLKQKDSKREMDRMKKGKY